MTAEVAILNRNAVALAADSAVTLQLPEGSKIYQTNKLFTLSKYEPVGVMVYGNADFMGVPWETIVKRYRAHLGRRSFSRLGQYGQDFLRFVKRNSDFFPQGQQERYCYSCVRAWLRKLRTRLRHALEEKLKSEGPQTERAIRALFRKIFAADSVHLRRHKILPSFRRTTRRSLERRYARAIRSAISDELQKLASAVPARRLLAVAVDALMRDLYWENESGIVVAGFGSNEFFPTLRCYTLDSIIGGRLRGLENVDRRTEISHQTSAAVIAFAQGEMVSLFMNGIDDDYAQFIMSFVEQSLHVGYPGVISDVLKRYVSASQHSRVLKRLRHIGEQLVSALSSGLRQYSREMHSGPIVDIVDHLPKEELAAMAEALVNLT